MTFAAAAKSAPSVGCPLRPSGVISALLHTQPTLRKSNQEDQIKKNQIQGNHL
jgi:NADH:ubiquinone oxidoreductase subunit B-like Fe-S oxidoreductase